MDLAGDLISLKAMSDGNNDWKSGVKLDSMSFRFCKRENTRVLLTIEGSKKDESVCEQGKGIC